MRFAVAGKETGRTIVFIHGWPDGPQLWEAQVQELGKSYRCVLMTLPGYGYENDIPFFGKSIQSLVTDFRDTVVNKIMAGRDPSEKPLLVMHDWGASIGYATLNQYPDLFEKVVALDIGQHVSLSVRGKLFVLVYQWTLALLFLLPSFIGTPLTKGFAALLKVPPAARALIRNRMNYLYFQFWKGLFTKTLPASTSRFSPPKCPILFMYGTKKPLQFHSQRFVDHVKNQKGSAVIPVDGNHWFFNNKRTSAKCTEDMRAFFEAKL